MRRSRKYRIRKWREDCWARIFSLFSEYNSQRLHSKQEESTEEEEENEAAAKNGDYERSDE